MPTESYSVGSGGKEQTLKGGAGLSVASVIAFYTLRENEMEDPEQIESYMTDTEFTIPVDLKGTGKGSKTVKITYQFDDKIAEVIGNGEIKEVDDVDNMVDDPDPEKDGEKIPGKKKVKHFLSLNKQLTLMVTALNGKPIANGETFWPKVVYKYRDAIMSAIMADIYPKQKTSGA